MKKRYRATSNERARCKFSVSVFLFFAFHVSCRASLAAGPVELILAPADEAVFQMIAERVVREDARSILGPSGWSLRRAQDIERFPWTFRLDWKDFQRWRGHDEALLARYLRAFRFRRSREAVFWLFGDEPWPIQKARLAKLAEGLKARKFVLGPALAVRWERETGGILWTRRAGVFFLAVFLPCLSAFWLAGVHASGEPGMMGRAFLFSLALGSVSWLILQTDAFRWQSEPLYFVQAAYLAPFLGWTAARRLRGLRLGVAQAAAWAVLALALLRLGQHLPVSPWESAARDFFDVNIGLRPRIGEIFGWTCWSLAAGLTLSHSKFIVATPGWTVFALFGPAATLNSFLHAQSPISFIFARSCLGFFLGRLLAMVIKKFFQMIPAPRSPIPVSL